MTNRQDIFNLLRARAGSWVARDDINFLGGQDASRRMRELEEDIVRSNEWRLEERRDEHKRYEYRLMPIIPDAPQVKGIYRCTACGARPQSSMASLDPRYRVGRCYSCGEKKATFKQSPA